eukprot:8875410-Ditylum_brightwellii.AAC.1
MSEKVEIFSYAEVVDPSFLKLPTMDPLAVIGRTFIMAHKVDGSVHCAGVMHHVESMDSETEQYLVHLGDGKQKESMTYDAIVASIDRQLASEAEKTDEGHLWIFKEVFGHRKNGQTWDVTMKWEDDSETWEPLA